AAGGEADVGRAAVVVDEVGAVLGLVAQPAQGQAPLPGVAGVAVAAARHDQALVDHRHALAGEQAAQPHQGDYGTGVEAGVVIGAAVGYIVDAGEEGDAVVDDGLVPLQLVEVLGREPVGDGLRDVEHVDRDQTLLDLRAGAAEGGGIDRV